MSPHEIINEVSDQYHMDTAKVLSPCRTAHVSLVRMIGMFVLRTRAKMTFPAIGKIMGRDHSTVVHAVNVIAARVAKEPQFGRQIAKVVARIAVKDREDNGNGLSEWPGTPVEVAAEDAL